MFTFTLHVLLLGTPQPDLEICRMRFMETHNSHVQLSKRKRKMRKILEEQKKNHIFKATKFFAYIFFFKLLTGYGGMHNKRKYFMW